MITKSLEAWVIHKRPSGDTSAYITLFTSEYGLVTALYRGARTPKKQSVIQAFTPLWVEFNVRHDRWYIRQMDMKSPTLPLTGVSLFSALYINELLHHALRLEDAYPQLYDAYSQLLPELLQKNTSIALEPLLRRFELLLLTMAGEQYSFTHDVDFNPIEPRTLYRFIPGAGLQSAKVGILGEIILAIASDTLNDPSVLLAAKKLLRTAIDHLIDGKPIKARELFIR